MGLMFNVVKRKVLAGEHAGKEMYFGQVKASTKIDFEKLCRLAAYHSSATFADVSGVITEVLRHISEVLLEGNVVQLGRLANLRLSAGSQGVDYEEDFTLHRMKRPRVIFSPGKELKNMLRNVTYWREPSKEKVVITGQCPDHPRG